MMFNNSEFNNAYNLIKNDELNEANKLLIKLRSSFFLHPDYLFLMSLLLIKSKRTYLAIDAALLSLKVDNTEAVLKKHSYENSSNKLIEERYLFLISMFKKIKNLELVDILETTMKNKNPTSFLLYLEKIMPGIRLKNKL
ncbi:hypothetical protein [Candidatus Pelagibacter sp. Uisw_130]|uniref:hypothetical protein n=1 Tax=Candidatus Pelagibacter sp. Uisw_130 TaxID=3230989 RepID=UPI0039EBD152